MIEGAFFPEFDPARHVITPFRMPLSWTRFRRMDWGSASPFSIGWWIVVQEDFIHDKRRIPKSAIIRYREWYGASSPNKGLRLPADAVAKEVVRRETDGRGFREPIAYGVMDPAAFAVVSGPSIGETFARLGVFFRRADNSRVSTPKRMGGWDQVRWRLKGDEDGDPLMFFVDHCRDSIRTLPMQQHDENRPEDLDTEGEDHAPDDIRYACMSRPFGARVETWEDNNPLLVSNAMKSRRTAGLGTIAAFARSPARACRCLLPHSVPEKSARRASSRIARSRPPRRSERRRRRPRRTSTEDIDTAWWERALSDAERAEKNWRSRGRDIVQIYRGDIPITRPKGGKYNAATSYSTKQDTASAFNILYANTEVMLPAAYAKPPDPVVRSRFVKKTANPIQPPAPANDGLAPKRGPSGHGASRHGPAGDGPSLLGIRPSPTGRGSPGRAADAAWGPDAPRPRTAAPAPGPGPPGAPTAPYPRPGSRGPADPTLRRGSAPRRAAPR